MRILKQSIVWILVFIGMLLIFTFVAVQITHGDTVVLQWDANDPAPDGYRIYQRFDGNTYDYTESGRKCETTETTCTIDDLLPGRLYFWVARAYVGENESGDSNEVSLKTTIPPPSGLKISVSLDVSVDINGVPYVPVTK